MTALFSRSVAWAQRSTSGEVSVQRKEVLSASGWAEARNATYPGRTAWAGIGRIKDYERPHTKSLYVTKCVGVDLCRSSFKWSTAMTVLFSRSVAWAQHSTSGEASVQRKEVLSAPGRADAPNAHYHANNQA
eukprot:4657756-Heterocapsa_arctica.AAC.1